MTDLELKRALNAYTQKGADRERGLKRELMASLPAGAPRRTGFGRLAAAAAVLLLAVSLVSFTQPGRAFAAAVGERIMGLIETVFPSKEVAVAPEGVICLSARDGLDWDSLCVDVRVIDDSQGGVYVLTAQYFMEAAEGHGARFSAMMDTFRLLE